MSEQQSAEKGRACECPPCPGRGNDGHGMSHCAECCWGSGVVADLDCPTHGDQRHAPVACGARIATPHPQVSQECALPVLHGGDCSPLLPPTSDTPR